MRKNGKCVLLAAVFGSLTMTGVSADVVLSGRLIGSVENIRGGGNNTDADGNQIFVPRTRFNDESSYVRISGLEDLGGGVQAGFQIESGFDLSGGSASGDNFNTVNTGNTTKGIATRNSGIFMRGEFGKILFGRWDVFYDTIYLIEPDRKSLANKVSLLSLFNTPTGGSSGITRVIGDDSNLGDRYNNVLSYSTPILAGLQLQLAYVPTNESSALSKEFNGQIYMGTLSYNPDYYLPLTLMASGFQQKADMTTSAQSPNPGVEAEEYRLTAGRFGAAVKLPLTETGTLHIGAVYQLSKLSFNTTVDQGPTPYKRRSFGIPLALMLGSNTVYFTYGHNGKLKVSDHDRGGSDANFYMVGYNYDISKRTAVGAYYARLKNGSNASYDFYVNGLNNGEYSLANDLGISPRAAGISFRHLF